MTMRRNAVCCIKCSREFACAKNGISVLITDRDGTPLEIYQADGWECSGCGFRVITGFAPKPHAIHLQPGFEQALSEIDFTIPSGARGAVETWKREPVG